ncbi:gem-associated protein 5 [Vespula squamosa]|uniref:Gem-associated protein 5 n=1 Tax=Vespula squamosa TaxID=30214 RepID=A0ABD2B9I0_VESSQ
MCEAYASQVILQSNPTKAMSYLFCIHKIYENVFQNVRSFKYYLAKSKLDSDDTTIKTILRNWANYKFEKDNFEAATNCYVIQIYYLMIHEAYSEAFSLIARGKDIESLTIAAKLTLL